MLCAGEIRGQVVFADAWDYSRPIVGTLDGLSAIPGSGTSATGSVQILLSKDRTMAVAHGGVVGALEACGCIVRCVVWLCHAV